MKKISYLSILLFVRCSEPSSPVESPGLSTEVDVGYPERAHSSESGEEHPQTNNEVDSDAPPSSENPIIDDEFVSHEKLPLD